MQAVQVWCRQDMVRRGGGDVSPRLLRRRIFLWRPPEQLCDEHSDNKRVWTFVDAGRAVNTAICASEQTNDRTDEDG